MEILKKTPLNEVHKSLGAKMVPFSGWEMPVQYTSIINEHLATRTSAGLFDVSHMGEIFIEGPQNIILPFLERMTCNLVETLSPGQVQYNAIMNEAGGLVDDVTVYKFNNEKYLICSNASNFESVFAHLKKYEPQGISLRNESPSWHQIAIQGPKADAIFSNYTGLSFSDLGYYRFKTVKFLGEEILVSRTGYTGEDGFEIYSSNSIGVQIWKDVLESGKSSGLIPVGLGARDTLRLEAKYPLYGHELNMDRTPVESGIGWIVKEKSIAFLGYEKVISQKKYGAKFGLTGVKLTEPGVPREHYKIFMNNSEIGETTSGTYSPSLKEGIALAVVEKDKIKNGNAIEIEIRGSRKTAIMFTENFITGSVKRNK